MPPIIGSYRVKTLLGIPIPFSEAPSVARSYTISQHSNQVGYLSFFSLSGLSENGGVEGANSNPNFWYL